MFDHRLNQTLAVINDYAWQSNMATTARGCTEECPVPLRCRAPQCHHEITRREQDIQSELKATTRSDLSGAHCDSCARMTLL